MSESLIYETDLADRTDEVIDSVIASRQATEVRLTDGSSVLLFPATFESIIKGFDALNPAEFQYMMDMADDDLAYGDITSSDDAFRYES